MRLSGSCAIRGIHSRPLWYCVKVLQNMSINSIFKVSKCLLFFIFFFSIPVLAEPTDKRPNILLLVSDDQNYGTVGDFMPEVQKKIFDQGLTFRNTFITTSICCPSRASILTGMYASRHKVFNNKFPLNKPTFVGKLQASGYFTALIGKYLNSWPGEPRSEFDYWISFRNGSAPYLNPELNVKGNWQIENGYITDILTQHVLSFLDQAAISQKPFFLMFTPNAPHDPATPDKKYAGLYHDLKLQDPPNFNPSSMPNKPKWLQEFPKLSEKRVNHVRRFKMNQLRSLKSLDDGIGKILDKLKEQGKLDNTIVVYISDNGLMNGAHRLNEKNFPYDEAMHVPCALRYPKLVPSARMEDKIIANIDFAPTFYEIANLTIPAEVQGRSLLPLIKNPKVDWRKEIYIEGWPRDRTRFSGVRTDRYKYIETEGDRVVELYDLANDPYELKNIAGNAELKDVQEQLQGKLKTFLAQRDDDAPSN